MLRCGGKDAENSPFQVPDWNSHNVAVELCIAVELDSRILYCCNMGHVMLDLVIVQPSARPCSQNIPGTSDAPPWDYSALAYVIEYHPQCYRGANSTHTSLNC